MLRTLLNMAFLDTKGQVTPESTVQSDRNSNLFVIFFIDEWMS